MSSFRATLDRVPLLAAACVVMVLLAAWALVSSVTSYVSTLTMNQDAAAPDREEAQIEAFRRSLEEHIAQVDGRSLFFTPGPPRPPRVEPQVVDSRPREPLAPTRYGGPSIIAMVNGAVWFSDGQRLEPGQSGRGVEVVSMDPPWRANVRWQGGEFDVLLFARDGIVYKTEGRGTGGGVLLSPSAGGTGGTGALTTPEPLVPPAAAGGASPGDSGAGGSGGDGAAPTSPGAPPAPPPETGAGGAAEPATPAQAEPEPATEPSEPEPSNEPETR